MSDNYTVLPDGSGFFTASFALPKDHWIYKTDADGFTPPPPMPFRMGMDHPMREEIRERIIAAAQYAVRASTRCGKETDFDPDAMVQNMIIGMIGYFTSDGLSGDTWGNPDPIPPEVK